MRQSEPRRSVKSAADEAAAASGPSSAEERIGELEAELAEARRAQDLAEARYAAMTANAPVGVAVIGLDGRFSDVNSTLCAQTGRAPEEIVGHFPTEFSPPDQVERSRAQFRKLIGGSGLEFAEVELRHKDGHAVWVNVQLSLVRDSEGRPQHAILMAQDITGRKLGELALQAANARLARVVETQNAVAAAAPEDLDAVIRFVAERAQTMTGAHGAIVELLDGDTLVARAATGTSASMFASMRPLAGSAPETAFSQRCALIHAESATICAPFFRGESAVGALTVEGDAARFTEEHRQTLELLAVVLSSTVSRAEHVAALERFERIYRGSPIGIGMLGLDRQWLEVNDALCEVVGRSAEELRTITPAAYVHPEDRRETAAAWATLAAGVRDAYQIEARYIRPDGEVIWVSSSLSLVRDATGAPQFALVVAHDITQRKLAELQLQQQTRRVTAIAATQAEIANAGSDLDAAMAFVAQRVRELTSAQAAAVVLAEGHEVLIGASCGEGAPSPGARRPIAGTLTAEVLAANKAQLVDDPADPRLYRTVFGVPDIESAVAVPLRRGDRIAGTIVAVSTNSDRPLTDDDVQTLDLLAVGLSAALSRTAELEAERRRVEALARFEAIFKHSPMAIGLLGLNGAWIDRNPASVEVTGRSIEEQRGVLVSEYTHPDDVTNSARQFGRMLRGEHDSYELEHRTFHKDGHVIWTKSRTALVRDANSEPEFAVVISEDTTERKRFEQALEEQSARFSRIAETQAELAAIGPDVDAAMQLVADRTRELVGSDVAAVFLVDGDELVAGARSGDLTPDTPVRLPLEGSVAGQVVRTGRPLLVNEPTDESGAQDIGVESLAAVPLFQGERAAGVILASSTSQDRDLHEDAVRTLGLLAAVLSSTLSRAAELEAEHQRVEALSQFEAAWGTSPIGIEIISLDGRIVAANPAMDDVYGYSLEEYETLFVSDFTHPEDVSEVARRFYKLISGEYESDTCQIEARFFHKTRGLVWVDGAMALVRDAGGTPQYVLGMAQNVTERKQAELALQEHSERLARLIETQADAIAAGFDVDTVSKLVAERAIEVIGAEGAAVNLLDGDELVVRAAVGLSASWLGFRRPASEAMFSKDSLRDGRATLVEHFGPLMEEWPALEELGDGSSVTAPVYQGDKIVGTINVLNSEQGRRLGEDDRQVIGLVALVLTSALTRAAEYEALSRLEAIYNSAPIGIGLLNMNGAIVDANPAMLAITGASSLGGNPVTEIAHPDDVAEMSANFGRLARGEIESYRHEARYFKTDGGVAWVDSTVSVIRDADGRPKFALTMAQDVSERRAAEDQLRQAQKMEAVGQLSAGIAHDFNNLLMGVLGYAGLARGDVPDDSRVAEYLDRIEQSGQRAASLTKQLLAFGRRQTLQARDLDLNDLVAETLSMLERLLGEQIEIVSRPEPSLPPLRADPTQLQQVLLNLALNARDAMPSGGTLTITTAAVEIDADDLDEPSELVPGRYVRLTVADTGLGMAADVRGRIFEPFFTTKGVGEGTGLGLPSVYGIVKQSRGDIEVDSEPGFGTTFRIYLPSAAQPVEADAADAPTPRVLLVDDAPIVRDLVTTLLGDNGYDVVPATGAAEALAFAQEGHYDVLITDLVLSRADGADLAARVQEYQPTIRVLYMTAYVPDRRIDPGSLISKPFANDELLSKLGAMLASETEV